MVSRHSISFIPALLIFTMLATTCRAGQPDDDAAKQKAEAAAQNARAGQNSQSGPNKTQSSPATPAKNDNELPRGPMDEKVFLTSGDIKILAADVDKILLLMVTEEKKRAPKSVPSEDRLLRSRLDISEILLQNAVIEKYARDHNLVTPKADIDKLIELKKVELKRDGSTFEQMLADTGQTEDEFRAFWSAKTAIEKECARQVAQAEIDKYFNEHKDQIPLRSAAHILYQYKGADSAPNDLTRTKEEARALADEALKKAKAGADFAKLAASSDDDATKTNGGSLPYFPLKGKDAMVESFGKAAYSCSSVGDFTPVIETPYGFHIIKVTGIKDAEIKQEVRRYLGLKKFDELLRPILMKSVETAVFNDKLVPDLSKVGLPQNQAAQSKTADVEKQEKAAK